MARPRVACGKVTSSRGYSPRVARRGSDAGEILGDITFAFRVQNRNSGRIEVAREQVPAMTIALHPHRNALLRNTIGLTCLEEIFAHRIGAGSRERNAIEQASLA